MSYGKTVDKQLTIAQKGREIAADLRQHLHDASPAEKDLINAYALRLAECNSTRNTWIDEASSRADDGRLYHQTGRYWRCNSKLCPSCLSRQVRRNRRRLRDAVNAYKTRLGEYHYFATLTIPTPNCDYTQTRSIVDYAWSLFRKRSLCVSLFRGGVKTEEFTVTPTGFHYHLHLIIVSRYLPYEDIRPLWTDCVKKSFAHHGIPLSIRTASGQIRADFDRVTPTPRLQKEVCKYITKATSWSKISSRAMLQILKVQRWARMFELFGVYADRSSKNSGTNFKRSDKTKLVTRSISDEPIKLPRNTWREILDKIGIDAFESYLLDKIEDAIYYEKERFALDETTKYRKPLAEVAAARLQCA